MDGKKLNDRLNELGEEGWELVSVFDTNMLEGKTRDVYGIPSSVVSNGLSRMSPKEEILHFGPFSEKRD